MANAKKCDRCGKYYTPYLESELEKFAASVKKAFVLDPILSRTEEAADLWDLCSDCRESFASWFAMKGEDD